MKIGIDCRMYRSAVAGIGRYSQNLITNLLEIDSEDQFVLFMTKEDAEEYQKKSNQNSNVKIVVLEIPHYSIAEQTKLGKIIKKENLDLMHFLNFNYPVNYKGKFIVTIHDLTLLFFPETARQTNFLKRQAFNHVMKKACQNSAKIIAVSESTKNDIVKAFKTDPGKIEVIFEAADDKIQEIRNPKSEIRNKYQTGDKPIILAVGQFRPHKNLPGLVEAFDYLKKDLDCKLVILGKSDSKHKKFFDALNNSPFKEDIILPGFVGNDELAAWYNKADVFVFPSFYEGFGLPGLEAMQAGLPVAASNVSSLPEIYKDAAVYFNPLKKEEIAAKIKEILKSEKLRQDLIRKGRELVKTYSWQKTAQETLNLYKKVLK